MLKSTSITSVRRHELGSYRTLECCRDGLGLFAIGLYHYYWTSTRLRGLLFDALHVVLYDRDLEELGGRNHAARSAVNSSA